MYCIIFSFIKKTFIEMPIVGDFKSDYVDVKATLLSLVGNTKVCILHGFSALVYSHIVWA